MADHHGRLMLENCASDVPETCQRHANDIKYRSKFVWDVGAMRNSAPVTELVMGSELGMPPDILSSNIATSLTNLDTRAWLGTH